MNSLTNKDQGILSALTIQITSFIVGLMVTALFTAIKYEETVFQSLWPLSVAISLFALAILLFLAHETRRRFLFLNRYRLRNFKARDKYTAISWHIGLTCFVFGVVFLVMAFYAKNTSISLYSMQEVAMTQINQLNVKIFNIGIIACILTQFILACILIGILPIFPDRQTS